MKSSRTKGHQLSPTISLSPTNSELDSPFGITDTNNSSMYNNSRNYNSHITTIEAAADDYLVPTRPRKNSFLTTLKHKLSMKRLPASTGQLHYDGTESGPDHVESPFADLHVGNANTNERFTEQWTQKSANIRKRSNTVSTTPVPPPIPENDTLPSLNGHRGLQMSKSALNLHRQWKSQEQNHSTPVPPLPTSGLTRIDNTPLAAVVATTPVSLSSQTSRQTRVSNNSPSNTSSFTLSYEETKLSTFPGALQAPQRPLTPEFDSRLSRDSFGAGSYYFGNDGLLTKQPAPSRKMSFLKTLTGGGR